MSDIDPSKGSPQPPSNDPKNAPPVPDPWAQKNQDPDNPYSVSGMEKYLVWEIDQLMADIKSGKMDITTQMAVIFGHLTSFFDNVVGQDSQSQSAMNKYIGGASEMQKIFQDTDGTPLQQVNPYTGKPEWTIDPKTNQKVPVYAPPEAVLNNEAHYLITNPLQQYELGDDGKPKIDKMGNKIKNPSYAFYQKNNDLYNQTKQDIVTAVTGMSNGQKVTFDDKSGYFSIPQGDPSKDPKDIDPVTGLPRYSGGIIQSIHAEANPQPDPSDPSKPVPQPNLTRLNAWNTAMGNTTQSYTNTSSAVQAVIKTDTQTYQSANSSQTKVLSGITDLSKAFVQGQKTS